MSARCNTYALTLPTAEAGGFFVHPTRLRRALANTARRGGLSRSDLFRRTGTRSHLPGGTEMGHSHQGSSQDIPRGVLVSVQHQATVGADVGAHGERHLDAIPTPAAILGGVV